MEADLVVVENLCSLPLNPAACRLLADVLRSRRALLRHHDLPWQREATSGMPAPPDDPAWVHVTVNELQPAAIERAWNHRDRRPQLLRHLSHFREERSFEIEARGRRIRVARPPTDQGDPS